MEGMVSSQDDASACYQRHMAGDSVLYGCSDKYVTSIDRSFLCYHYADLLTITPVVSLVSKKTSVSLAMSSQMLTVLGIVLGLVVSFRTTSAYDR